jgi:CubicO group peptidase (beta-lactamase class C family)
MKQCLLFLSLSLFLACSPEEPQPERFIFGNADPQLHGLSADSLEKVSRFLEEAVQEQWIPGAVAVIVSDGDIVYEEAVGYSDTDRQAEMRSDHIFRLASMTKAITSTAVLMLADRGDLNLDDPVSRYIPEFSDPQVVESVDFSDSTWTTRPASREVTIHDLLTHTSGIAYGFADSTMNVVYLSAGVPDGIVTDNRTIEQTMATLGSLPLKHDPGEQYTYGLNTDVLGRVVEAASGMRLDRFFQSEIFEPLGMDDTSFYLPAEKAGRLVPMYQNPQRNKLERVTKVSVGDSESVSPDMIVTGEGTYFSGGAGLSGTAHDYHRFMQMVLNRGRLGETRLMSEETADLLFVNQLGDLRVSSDGFSYGFLVTLDDGNHNHGRKPGRIGWGGIFQTTYWMIPDKKLSVVLMSQVFPSQHRQDLYNGFEKRVNAAITVGTAESEAVQ